LRCVVLALLLSVPSAAYAQGDGPTLLFGGDVIFDDPIDYALRQMHRSRDDAASYEGLFADLSLSDADLTIVNLETPVAERVRSREDGIDLPVFAAPRAFLEALAHAGGFDALTGSGTNRRGHLYDAITVDAPREGDQLTLADAGAPAHRFSEYTDAEVVKAELEVLGLDVRAAVLTGLIPCKENNATCFFGITFEHVSSLLPRGSHSPRR